MRRPHIHFTAPRGWINDPNGCIYLDGYYHLFYQHNPKDISWGPMHWGHARSRDLIHWEHEPVALEPTEDEWIFSGSCFLDRENVSGLGEDGKPALLAFYTAHHPSDGREEQCLAYSLDYVHFTRYEKNPILVKEASASKDFRDPKILLGPAHGYNMVLSAGRHIEIYQSDDLLNWKKSGEFDPSEYGFAGICECPDLFPLIDGDKLRYVLTMSMILDEERVSGDYDISWKEYRVNRVMQYFVGQFDGENFHDTQVLSEPSILDYGTDDYAMISFYREQEVPKTQFMIGWAEHWETVNDRPTVSGVCKGKMTLGRQVSLVRTDSGTRLAMKPYLPGEYRLPHEMTGNDSYAFNPMKPVIAHMQIERKGTVRLCNGLDEEVLIVVDTHEIEVDCRYASSVQFGLIHENTNRDVHRASRHTTGACELLLIYDEGVLEIYAESGVTVFTVNVYPNVPYTQLVVLEQSEEF